MKGILLTIETGEVRPGEGGRIGGRERFDLFIYSNDNIVKLISNFFVIISFMPF